MTEQTTASNDVRQNILLAAALLIEHPHLLTEFSQQATAAPTTDSKSMLATADEEKLLKHIRRLDPTTMTALEMLLEQGTGYFADKANSQDAEMTAELKRELQFTSSSLAYLSSAIKAVNIAQQIRAIGADSNVRGGDIKDENQS